MLNWKGKLVGTWLDGKCDERGKIDRQSSPFSAGQICQIDHMDTGHGSTLTPDISSSVLLGLKHRYDIKPIVLFSWDFA
jgi:hypothetical protein